MDIAFNKSLSIYGERIKITLHWEIFNLFNWVNWNTQGESSISVANPADFSMKAYWTAPSREMQVGGRVSW